MAAGCPSLPKKQDMGGLGLSLHLYGSRSSFLCHHRLWVVHLPPAHVEPKARRPAGRPGERRYLMATH